MYNERNKGITLIALVVTIIVLLILAGISILMLSGENGILKRAGTARDLTKYSGYKEEVDLYFQGKTIENGFEQTNNEEDIDYSEKLKEYFEKGRDVFGNISMYNDVEPITDASTNLKTLVAGDDSYASFLIVQYRNNKYKVSYYSYSNTFTVYYVKMLPKRNENQDIKLETIKDKGEIKKIIPDITEDDLEKLSIQKGKLVYNPEKVNNDEKNIMESVGILAMTIGATIIFMLNGQEYTRIQSNNNKIVFPPTPYNYDENYSDTFIGWYTDLEIQYTWSDSDMAMTFDKDLALRRIWSPEANEFIYTMEQPYGNGTMNPQMTISSYVHEQFRVNEGDEIDGDEIILYPTFRGKSGFCLAEGTKVTMADGSKKNIEDIVYEDKLKVWNFDEGKLDTAEPLWIMKKQIVNKYIQLTFDNGKQLKLFQHRIFNVDKQEFSHAQIEDETPIGTTVFMEDGTTAKLIERKEIEDETNVYNILTKEHINLFAEGILTSLRFNDIYQIKDMKFVKDNRELNKRENYPNIPDEYFYGLRLAEQKNTIIDSGKTWWEERVNDLINKRK